MEGFTVSKNGKAEFKEGRPLLLLTSTSYTPDEDIGLLVSSLEKYADKASEKLSKLPKIHLVVTGAGPQKAMFLKRFASFNEGRGQGKVKIEAKWLEFEDYPLMVASADLGICMHMSSSNLDLPMKVVDMFSCKVPCFAYDYPTIGELVQADQTGALFKTTDDLYNLMTTFFANGTNSTV